MFDLYLHLEDQLILGYGVLCFFYIGEINYCREMMFNLFYIGKIYLFRDMPFHLFNIRKINKF